MYCVKCGVSLDDSQKVCPLCNTQVFHPHISRGEGEELYPKYTESEVKYNPKGLLFIFSVIFALPIIITLLTDLRINDSITWSGYVVGSVVLAYVMFILPFWFRNPNPVVFTPVSFAVIIGFLWFIDYSTSGLMWFLSFGFPVAGIAGLLLTAVITLCKYIKRGYLFIFGGASIATGVYICLIELFLHITFENIPFVFWSLYPLVAFVLIGGMLITIGASKPLRESLSKKFFI